MITILAEYPLSFPERSTLDAILDTAHIPHTDVNVVTLTDERPPEFFHPPTWWEERLPAAAPKLLPLSGYVVPMGKYALKALTGKQKLDEYLGAPAPCNLPGVTILPTFSLELCITRRSPQYRVPVSRHIRKAWEYANGTAPEWQWGEIVCSTNAPESAVIAALQRCFRFPRLALDIETPRLDDSHPERFPGIVRNLYNIGFASREGGLAVSVDWQTASPAVKALCKQLCESDIPKVLQNGQFDVRALAFSDIHVKNYWADTMLLARLLMPRLPASLGYLSALLTYAPKHKEAFREQARARVDSGDVFSDSGPHARALYNAQDCVVTEWVWDKLEAVLKANPWAEALWPERMALTRVGIKMTQKGRLVDEGFRQDARLPARKAQAEALWSARRTARRLDLKGFSPTSGPRIRAAFNRLGVSSYKHTGKGAESFDAEVLLELTKHLNPDVRELAQAIKSSRDYGKLLSTYLDGLPVWEDGRIHSVWFPCGAVTGRWPSRQPNDQNRPNWLDPICRASPGMWIVHADYSQIELRLVALFAGDDILLDAYNSGKDVHTINAEMIFACKVDKRTPIGKAMRNFAKIFVYAANYGSGVRTIWENVVSDESIPESFRKRLTLIEVAKLRTKWFLLHPKILEYQMNVLRKAEKDKYVECLLSGLRQRIYGTLDPSLAYNFIPQAGTAKIANDAVLTLNRTLDASIGECIVAQVHDAIECEGPDPVVLEHKMREAMERHIKYRGKSIAMEIETEKFFAQYGPWRKAA